MDCERFDQHVIDELYDELDEVTHAALERHVAGCSRCAGALAGLRATRAVAILPLVEPPDDIEARILARLDTVEGGKEPVPAVDAAAQKAPQGGVVRFLRWAARPSVAMAAAFLLLIGASVFLFQGSAKREAPATAAAEASPPAIAAAPTAAPAATASAALGKDAEEAKVAEAEPQRAAATAADGGPPAQEIAGGPFPVRAAAAAHAAAKPAAPAMLADEKPADAAAGVPAGGRASKKADIGGTNPRAAAAPAPRAPAKPVTAVGFAP